MPENRLWHRASSRSRVAAYYHHLRNGLFGSFFVLQRKITPHFWVSIFAQLVSFLQLMHFVLRKEAGFPWNADTIAPLRWILAPGGIRSSVWSESPIFGSASSYFSLFSLALFWVVVYVSLQAWAIAAFMRGNIPAIWPLRALRIIANVTGSVAYVPLFSMLLSIFQCGGDHVQAWEATTLTCYSNAHVALAAIAGVAAALLSVLSGLFSLFFYDSHLFTTNITGKVHGRVEFLALVARSLLVLSFDIIPNQLGAPMLAAISLIVAFVLTATQLICMPYLHHSMNQWRLAAFSMFLWTSLCAVISLVYEGFDAAVLVYVGLPLTAALGVAATSARRAHILAARVPAIWTPYDAEMRVRFKLQAFVEDLRFTAHAKNAALSALHSVGDIPAASTTTTTATQSNALQEHGTMSPGKRQKLAPLRISVNKIVDEAETWSPTAGAAFNAVTSPSVRPAKPAGSYAAPPSCLARSHGMGTATISPPSQPQQTPHDLEDVSWELSFDRLDAEARAAVVRKHIPAHLRSELDSFYKQCILKFPLSAIMQVFIARYYAIVHDNHHQQMGHLLQVTRLHPPVDVAFLAYQARRHLESLAGSGAQSALARVSLEKYIADARRHVYRAASAQLQFWSCLASDATNVSDLHRWSRRLTDASAKAEAAFAEIFSMDAQSVMGLRLLGQYHLAVSNNPDRAAAAFAEASRLEDMRAKEHYSTAGIAQHFGLRFFHNSKIDVHADNVAIISISAVPRDLGAMQSVNAFACRLFGYARGQLLHQNLNMLLPSPIAEMHDGFLRRYLGTGDGKFVDMSRIMFAKHRSGAMFPVLLTVREAPNEDDSPSFVGLLRPLNTPDSYILLDSRFNIMCVCVNSAAAMGIDPQHLPHTGVNLEDFVQDWHLRLAELHAAASVSPDHANSVELQILQRVDDDHLDDSRDTDDEEGHGVRVHTPSSDLRPATLARAQLQTVRLAGVTIHILVWHRVVLSRTCSSVDTGRLLNSGVSRSPSAGTTGANHRSIAPSGPSMERSSAVSTGADVTADSEVNILPNQVPLIITDRVVDGAGVVRSTQLPHGKYVSTDTILVARDDSIAIVPTDRPLHLKVTPSGPSALSSPTPQSQRHTVHSSSHATFRHHNHQSPHQTSPAFMVERLLRKGAHHHARDASVLKSPVRGDDEGSHRSTTVLGKRLQTKLRRAIQQQARTGVPLAAVRCLQLFGVVVLVLSVAFMVASAVVLCNEIQQFDAAAEIVDTSSSLHSLFVKADFGVTASKLQSFDAWNAMPPYTADTIRTALLQEQSSLQSGISSITDTDNNILFQAVLVPDVSGLTEYAAGTITEQQLEAQQQQNPDNRFSALTDGRIFQYSLYQTSWSLFLYDCAAALSSLMPSNVAMIAADSTAGLIFIHAQDAVRTVTATIEALGAGFMLRQEDFMYNFVAYSILAGSFGLPLILLLGYVPALLHLQRRRNKLLNLFQKIPPHATMLLKALAEKRLRKLYMEDDADNDEETGDRGSSIHSDGSEVDSLRTGGIHAALQAIDSDDDHGETIDWMAFTASGGALPHSRTLKEKTAAQLRVRSKSIPSNLNEMHIKVGEPVKRGNSSGVTPELGIPALRSAATLPPRRVKQLSLCNWQTMTAHGMKTVVSIMSPCFVILLCFVTVYIFTVTDLGDVMTTEHIRCVTRERETSLEDAIYSSVKAISSTSFTSDVKRLVAEADNAWLNTMGLQYRVALGQEHHAVNSSLLHLLPPSGSELQGFTVISSQNNEFLHSCMFSDTCECGYVPHCRQRLGSLPYTGLHATLTAIYTQCRALLQARAQATLPLGSVNGTIVRQNTTQAYSISAELVKMQQLYNATMSVVLPGFAAITYVHSHAISAGILRYIRFQIAFTFCCVALLFVLVLRAYLPTVHAVHADMWSKRAMLLLVPPALLATVPALRQAAQNIVFEAGNGNGSPIEYAVPVEQDEGGRDEVAMRIGTNTPEDALDSVHEVGNASHLLDGGFTGGAPDVTYGSFHRQSSNLRKQAMLDAASKLQN